MNNIVPQPETRSLPPSEQKLKQLAQMIYIIQGIGVLIPILFLVALVLNAMRMSSIQDSPLIRSHFRWQLRTFWFGLLWVLLGWMLLAVYIGLPILFINTGWVIYRIVKGWLSLKSDQLMYPQ